VSRGPNSEPAVSYESLENRCKFLEEGVAKLRLDLDKAKPCPVNATSELLDMKNQHAVELEKLKLQPQKRLKEFMDTNEALKTQHVTGDWPLED
jgi:hypothetical protein